MVTVRVEGDIAGRWVEELRRECFRALDGGAPGVATLVLDLAGVSSIDATGLALFQELGATRLVVRNCSPYVAQLLDGLTDVER